MSNNTNSVPRRIIQDQQTPAERAITDAMRAVEEAGCDPRLTDAVRLLSKARERVADFVDGVNPMPDPAKPQPPSVPIPTPNRIVEVDIAEDDEKPVWRPAMVVTVWPEEFPGHPSCPAAVNVQVFLDGRNDERTLMLALHKSYANGVPEAESDAVLMSCARGLLHLTSVPYIGAPRKISNEPGAWAVRGPRWRWPPRKEA